MTKHLRSLLLFLTPDRKTFTPFLREHAVLYWVIILTSLLLLSSLTYTWLRVTTTGSSVFASVVYQLTNEVRAEYGLSPLRYSQKLYKAAEAKGYNMFTENYFSHTSPTGKNAWYWISKENYTYETAGENLAFNFNSSEEVKKAWVSSPSHKENLLSKTFTETGVAVVRGEVNNTPTILIVQLFGKPVSNESAEPFSYFKDILHTFIFKIPYYISLIYILCIYLIAIILIRMIFLEAEHHHYKHVVYGIFLVAFISSLHFLNSFLL
jgi:uncharacterized protein YkwD